jgi:S-adenosylmethionine:tRNA ribosyltransferase-isomerase
MRPATRPHGGASQLKLLVVGLDGISHQRQADFPSMLESGDLVIANDAATVPASLSGLHAATSARIEVRLAGVASLGPDALVRPIAVVFGAGDYRTVTEERPLPPRLFAGDQLLLGPLRARIRRVLDHPRLVELQFDGSSDVVWNGIARHGRAIQYAYVPEPLAPWDTWTRIAARPVAFEPPSAGFILNWSILRRIRRTGARFATITHAAGISSTGDPELDARLPFDEPYEIPAATAQLIAATRAAGGRVIAIGTTVVRALEHAACGDGTVRSGIGVATGRIGAGVDLRVVDALVSGMHEPGTSHYQLLEAFVDGDVLTRAIGEAEARGYQAHEFGDAAFIVRQRGAQRVTSAHTGLTSPALQVGAQAGLTSPALHRPDPRDRYAMRILRGNCELSSRNVFLRDSSAAVGCTTPLASVARDTSVCSPGVTPSHL